MIENERMVGCKMKCGLRCGYSIQSHNQNPILFFFARKGRCLGGMEAKRERERGLGPKINVCL